MPMVTFASVWRDLVIAWDDVVRSATTFVCLVCFCNVVLRRIAQSAALNKTRDCVSVSVLAGLTAPNGAG